MINSPQLIRFYWSAWYVWLIMVASWILMYLFKLRIICWKVLMSCTELQLCYRWRTVA